MKKLIAIICIVTMLMSLVACGTKTKDYSGQTVVGKVTAVDGTKVTLQLGTLTEMQMGENNQGGQPQDMPSTDGQPEQGDINDGQQPPEMPSGDAGESQTPPEMPSGSAGEGQTLPEMPSGDAGEGQTPPEMPSGDAGEGQTPPEMPDGIGQSNGGGMPAAMYEFTAGDETVTFDLADATINYETAQQTLNEQSDAIAVGDVLELVIDEKNTVKSATVKFIGNGMNGNMTGGFGGSAEVTQGTSANTIDTDGEYDGTYTSTGDDENALRVDGATVTLSGITVEKTDGATSNTENGDFYGMNAGLLATNGAVVTINNATVNTSAKNGNGVFSYGKGTVVNISDSVISTTSDNSGGIQTTGGGTTNASNLTVTTSGDSAAAIRSDRGGGTVVVESGSYTSNGYNSPAVYSTADITIKNATLTATNSEALVIEGKNSIKLENCTVSGNMSDDKGSASAENVHNVMIYQSMSGDADVGTAEFSMIGGTMISNNGDLFYFTNTGAVMTLSNVKIENNETDGYFIKVCGNSESRGWGKAGANGAQVTFNAENQILEGDIAVDTISTLNMTLKSGSTFTGTVNIIDNAASGTAVSENAVITIEESCTWKLTGNCSITSLDNKGTIDFNGYTITLADGTVLS